MQVKNCEWEVANLGKKTKEFILNSNEDVNELLRYKDFAEYNVVKVSNRCKSAFHKLDGYNFVEAQINYELPLSRFDEENTKLKTFVKGINFEEVASPRPAIEKIATNIFTTDRIALDPIFGLDTAAKRYRNWISSSVEKDNFSFYNVSFKKKECGFYFFQESAGKVNLLLAGVYDENLKGLGVGVSVIIAPLLMSKSMGFSRISAKVSSNNPDVMRIYEDLGFKMASLEYVYIRHL